MATDHRTQWVFVFASGLGALGLAVAVLAVSGIDPEGIRRSLRVTARFSFILFWCAYAGGSLAVLFNVHFRWMARQGRNFGLSFASAHSIHLLLVIWLYRLSPEPPISTQGAVFFSIGLLWMYLLVLFSVERLSRKLGPSLWRKLRLVGMEYIMLAFQSDFLLHALPANTKNLLLYAPFATLGVAGTALRIVGWARKPHKNETLAGPPSGEPVRVERSGAEGGERRRRRRIDERAVLPRARQPVQEPRQRVGDRAVAGARHRSSAGRGVTRPASSGNAPNPWSR